MLKQRKISEVPKHMVLLIIKWRTTGDEAFLAFGKKIRDLLMGMDVYINECTYLYSTVQELLYLPLREI
jgi:hypothetical protein